MSLEPRTDGTTAIDCGCDAGESIAAHFDAKVRGMSAGANASLHGATQALLELLGDPRERTVLELGSGRGGMLLEVLRSGAAKVTGVDLSAASAEIAGRRIAAAGFADKATLTVGDGATLPLETHDWVVLDRVICCYPNLEALLASSVVAARSRYAFSVPDSRGWRGVVARAGRLLENRWNNARGQPCTTFVHDLDRIEQTLMDAGFMPRGRARRGFWYVAAFERA